MDQQLLHDLLHASCIALGVEIGGALLAGVATLLTRGHPLYTIMVTADELKFWGALSALGMSFTPLRGLEASLLAGPWRTLARQVSLVSAGLLGTHAGYLLLLELSRMRPR